LGYVVVGGVCVYKSGAKPLCAVATKGISPLPEIQGVGNG
jgi:hypothetical protein